MQKGKSFPIYKNATSQERLERLMVFREYTKKNGTPNHSKLAKSITELRLKNEKFDNPAERIRRFNSLQENIRKALKNKSRSNIDITLLKDICTVLECCSDYIVGIIDYPTYDMIKTENSIGLSSEAQKTMQKLIPNYLEEIELINFLLSEEKLFYETVKNLSLYFNVNQYSIPLYRPDAETPSKLEPIPNNPHNTIIVGEKSANQQGYKFIEYMPDMTANSIEQLRDILGEYKSIYNDSEQ